MTRESSVLPPGDYCAYLRKSRADHEAEARGEEETYAKHERIIRETAKRLGISISELYREKPITGERISERPEMIRLLEDVENGRWKGVLVVEIERLARGDTMDQGIVAQTFKYAGALIVTPMRIYDPNHPDDEEYFEFGLFMSRREFKTITRRLQSGRLGSVKEGKYVGNLPPYGYKRIPNPLGKGFTLEPHPEQAPIVRLIFSLYTDPDPEKRMGTARIAAYLNREMKVPTARNRKWTVATITGILRNPVYIGRVRWGVRPQVKRRDGKTRPRKPRGQWIEARGLHPPIVDEQTFQAAQDILDKNGIRPAPVGKLMSPLAGLVRCDVCGASMIRKPYRSGEKYAPPALICPTPDCPNVGSYLHLVEQRLLQALREWLSGYKADWAGRRPKDEHYGRAKRKAIEDTLQQHRKRLNELTEQKANLHDLLELKIYTVEQFAERSQIVAARIEQTKAAIAQAETELMNERKRLAARLETIPKAGHVLDLYDLTDNAADKNALLKSVLETVTYRKEKGGRWSGATDQFELVLYPKLPKSD